MARGHHKPRHCKAEVGEDQIKRRENKTGWTELRARATHKLKFFFLINSIPKGCESRPYRAFSSLPDVGIFNSLGTFSIVSRC